MPDDVIEHEVTYNTGYDEDMVKEHWAECKCGWAHCGESREDAQKAWDGHITETFKTWAKENYTFCDSIGPFDAFCVKVQNHVGEHEGYDAHRYCHRWTSEDYPERRNTNEQSGGEDQGTHQAP